MYDPKFVARLRKLATRNNADGKPRGLNAREIRAFVQGDSRLLTADELRAVVEDSTADERLRAQARAMLAMLK